MLRTILEGGIVIIISLFEKRPRYTMLDMYLVGVGIRNPEMQGHKTVLVPTVAFFLWQLYWIQMFIS